MLVSVWFPSVKPPCESTSSCLGTSPLAESSDVFDTILDEIDLSSALPSIDTLQPIESMTAFITFITPHAHKHSFTVDELLEVARTANVFRCRPFVSASVKRYVEKAFVGPITNSNFFALLR